MAKAVEGALSGKGKDTNAPVESSFFKEKDDTERKKAEEKLEVLRESLRTEEESELMSYEKRLVDLQGFLDKKVLATQEAAALRFDIEGAHEKKLADMKSAADQAHIALVTKGFKDQVSNISTLAQTLTGVYGKEGKKQFQIQKAASIAIATVKGYESVMSAFASGTAIGTPYLGATFAAAAAATSAAMIGNIASSSYGGNGGVASAPSGGSVSQAAAPQAQQQTQQRALHISGIDPSQLYSGETVQKLIEAFNQHVEDGGTLISSSVAA